MLNTETEAGPSSLLQTHILQPCWNMQLAGLDADAVRVALEFRLFDEMKAFVDPGELAARLSLIPANTVYFLELLWSMDVLERTRSTAQAPRYRTRFALQPYLCSDSPRYCGDALLFRHQVMRQVGMQLGDLLQKGVPAASIQDAAGQQHAWARAARLQLAQEQLAVTVDVACEIVSGLPEFPQMRTLLDLGGGPGLVAIALAELQPALSGVVYEYPAVAEVARENIKQAGLAERLSARGGDLAEDDFGAGYDLIWCSSVLHFVPDLPAMIARLHAALRPGGVLVCCHAEIADDASEARSILQYYLHMRMQGRHVLSTGQMAVYLRQAGFSAVEEYAGVRFPVAPVTVLIARKGNLLP